MLPIGPIIIAAVAAARAAGGAPGPPSPKGPLGLRHLILWGGSLFIIGKGISFGVRYPDYWPVLVLGAIAVACVLFPWWMNRLLIIPRGFPKVSYQLNRLAVLIWDGDMEAGRCTAALLAMLRAEERDEAFLKVIEDRLQRERMRGATVLAHALLFAVRGNHEVARKLAASISTLAPKVANWPVPALANEYLMLEASSRGDWAAVYESGLTARRPTWMTEFLHGVSARILGRSYPLAPFRLVTSWLLARHWISTWSLLLRGLHPEPIPAPPAPKPLQLDGADHLRDALQLHVAALRTPPTELLAEHVRLLGRAWDTALDDAGLQARFASSATSLAVLPMQLPLDSVRETVIGDLVVTLRAAKLPMHLWSEGSPTLEAVATKIRDEFIEAAEAAAHALARRKDAQKALSGVDEWREWLALRERYEEATRICGIGFRRLAFRQVHHDVCDYAVWLFNIRFEYPIAHAMFWWLLAEAKAVEDLTAISLQARNVKAGCGY